MKQGKGSEIAQVVAERVEILLSQAHSIAKKNLVRAKKYVKMARRLSEKYRVRFTKVQKMHFCKKCNTPFIPGHNVRIAFVPKTHQMVYECKGCGAVIKFPYKKKK